MKKIVQKYALWLSMLAILFGALPIAVTASTAAPYWAKANGATLYQTHDEGILRSIPPVECFQVTGSDANWLYVTTFASGGFRQTAGKSAGGVCAIYNRLSAGGPPARRSFAEFPARRMAF